MIRETKLLGTGGKLHQSTIEDRGKHLAISTHFNVSSDVKGMTGAAWKGYDKKNPEQIWLVEKSQRTSFILDYLEGRNPYTRFKSPPPPDLFYRKSRKTREGIDVTFYEHQQDFIKHILHVRHCIIAGEMGLGKTLAAIEAMELSHLPEIWYVAPKSALTSVKIEMMVWRCVSNVKFMTYDELKSKMKNWHPGILPPKAVFFDESSRLKNLESQRTQAAKHLADSMRTAYGYDSYIVLMTGSPAPKSPLDWWAQCEIAAPGYIKERDIKQFKNRMCVIEYNEDMMGGKFPVLKTWRNGNKDLCDHCGNHKSHVRHVESMHKQYCAFTPLRDEITDFYRRAKGLVLVKLKKDCLDLPDKVYRQVVCKPSLDLMRAARHITATSKSVITGLSALRELSDGFQYYDEKVEVGNCLVCNANKDVQCGECMGSGKRFKIERKVKEIPCPKLTALDELLEECEDTTRCVVYAGFTASIDRLCRHVRSQGWHFIRIDGRGWTTSLDGIATPEAMVERFQHGQKEDEKIVVVAHPGSAGMGLTLTASQMIVYYSNDFNGESRIQSEDRIHRLGMKDSALIVDLFLLPSDKKVFLNLKEKRELQSMSLGELVAAMEAPVAA